MMFNKDHLFNFKEEQIITEFHSEIFKFFYEMMFVTENCFKQANIIEFELASHEVVILNVIRRLGTPSFNQLAFLLNKQNGFNIAYSVKKLFKMQLIEKVILKENKRAVYWRVTEQGKGYTDIYRDFRNKVILNLFNQNEMQNLELITKLLRDVRTKYNKAMETLIYVKNSDKKL